MRTLLQSLVFLAKKVSAAIQEQLVDSPLRTLYFQGPLLAGYGFWAGASREDMCASLSPGTSAFFWSANAAQCEALLQQRYVAFCVAVKFILYLWALYRLLHWASFQLFVLRPVLRRVDHMMELRAADAWLTSPAPGAKAVPSARVRWTPAAAGRETLS
jgi:hypothetical protein